ncbi:TatD family deoxyribonuclease [Spironucleus salmonicida]|uniref:TatD family deoxyribonuclease n=1 Tax=Spironucleus salmonicida TaxID=348837 RepID=V6LHG8_9EUKA|nr:TatD family deoxyribonuclease [Spironucleus salmonicida]|eukprot:EST43992.1 TatD family deoxyribonuclease [Spironucleus salmonicida]
MLDTHVHQVALKEFDKRVALMINSVQQNDIQNIQQHLHSDNTYIGIGHHPINAHSFQQISLLELDIIQQTQTFIGEIGLDLRSHILLKNPIEKQKQVFFEYCRLGFQFKKLISIHLINRSPGCLEYILDVFKQLEFQYGGTFVIFHAFQCSYEQFMRFTRECMSCRFFAGVGYLNCDNKKLLKLDKYLVLETDMFEDSQNWDSLWNQVLPFYSDKIQLNERQIISFLNQE